jgi:hypothetical protein
MKIIFSLLFAFLFFLPTPLFAQTKLLQPYYDDSEKSPRIELQTPQKDSVVTSKFPIAFAVENFTLTAQPEGDERAGVVSLFVDGKFFENFASSSAQISIPKKGTHLIEVELTHVDRTPFVPRIADSMYVYVQSKTPYITVKNMRNEMTVYTDQPQFEIDFEPAVFEDTTSFIKVFVDGEVDGSTKDTGINTSYRFSNPLEVGTHSVRFVLFRENGKAYTPSVESSFSLKYSDKRPDISDVAIPERITVGASVPFKAKLENFTLGKDGYLFLRAGNKNYIFSTPEAQFVPTFQGAQKVSFQLLDKNGHFLNPPVSTEKVVQVSNASSLNDKSGASKFIPPGIFTTAQDGGVPHVNLLVLAGIEAVAIIAFGIFLVKKQK